MAISRNSDESGSLCELEAHIRKIGWEAPELTEIEIFHELTKLRRSSIRKMGRRIGGYLNDPRALRETAANFKTYAGAEKVVLPPPPRLTAAFDQVLSDRRSTRLFDGRPLTAEEVSAVLSSCRVTRRAQSSLAPDLELRFRPYPSGGGLYPTEIYVALTNVTGLPACLAHYGANEHALSVLAPLPPLSHLAGTLGDHNGHTGGIGMIVFVSILPERTVVKYGYRGYRLAMMEVGMVPFGLSLAATAAGLANLHWGGYFDDEVNSMLNLDGVTETVSACLFIGRSPEHE
ncbi:SagB/ThcOx family dehydrogenase [Rhodocista pekingensis]|uniref:SagB/ThcOx family dehydrogenase n=1 Tax=Rhodocista pekingensis TaxID=201185 RepID=A0ABW2KTM3_9PROT